MYKGLRLSSWLTTSVALTLTIIVFGKFATQSEAFYSIGPGDQQQALYDYYLQSPGDQLINARSLSSDGPIGLDGSTVYGLDSDLGQQSGSIYNGLNEGGAAAAQLDLVDVQKLVAYLKQLQSDNALNDDGSSSEAINDLNIHLSSTDPSADSVISGPINNPLDFEATLGQLTSAINHQIPNSSNRSEILDSLLSVYLGSVMQQMKPSQQQQPETDNNFGGDSGKILLEHDSELTIEPKLPSLRASNPTETRYSGSEYIDQPLALNGHQYVQGGAGEGRQLLGPDGSFENVQVVKSDHAVPSYCDPPNPCPLGYTAEDGCLENFVNSASFSREYQVKQQCSCDNEHSLFNCASPVSEMRNQLYSVSGSHNNNGPVASQQLGDGEPTEHSMVEEFEARQMAANKLDTLARTIQNRFGGLSGVRNLINGHEDNTDGQTSEDPVYTTIVKKGSHRGSDFKY